MKTIKQIIKTQPLFLNNWKNKEEVFRDFEHSSSNENILFASYGEDNYSGDAWVLFEKDGLLFEVNGSHCSCYGLEGQWEPESVVLEELKNRLEKGTFGRDDWSGNEFAVELKTFLAL